MTLEVHYTDRNGKEQSQEFETEQRAAIFMDGLNVREGYKFDYVQLPEDEPEDPYGFRAGFQG